MSGKADKRTDRSSAQPLNRSHWEPPVLTAVATKFEVDNPLSCGKVLKPKADFHERRWQQFDLETNLQLQTVLPTQVNLKPIRPDKSEK